MRQRLVFKRLIICLMAVCLLMTPMSFFSDAEETSDSEYHTISINNEYYQLTVSETDGRFTLTDKSSGQQIKSYPDGLDEDKTIKNAGRIRVRSALFVTLFDQSTEAKTELYSLSDAVNMGGIKVTERGNEYVVEYNFVSSNVVIPVHYTLDGKHLIISVLTDEIQETGSCIVMKVSIHPFFYSGSMTENGYLLVPDGSGSIIQFNNEKYSVAPYKQKVYGSDLSLYKYSSVENTQPVLMPMFGISKENGMALGVITAGAGDAYVEASPGIGTASYNCAYATFELMAQDMVAYPDDNRTDVDIYPGSRNDTELLQLTYSFQAGNSPAYAEMAALYRDYLIETYGLQRIQESRYSIYLDLTMSTIKNKSFLGVSYQGVETLTTFEEAQKLIEHLHEQGISTVVRLNNWSDQTVRGKVLNGADMAWSVGSKSDLEKLKATVEENGELYLNGNISEVYTNSFFAKFFSYAKNMRLSTIEYQEFNLATNFATDSIHYLLSHKSIQKYTLTFGKTVSKLGITNISVDGLDNMFTDYSAEVASLSGTVQIYEKALSGCKDSGLNVSVTGGNQYTLGSASLVFDMPSSDSMFEVCDESVPFYEIALHGYIPFTVEAINSSANSEKAYLKTLETGSGLYFSWMQADAEKARYSRNSELYCGNADTWMDSALSHYTEYAAFMKDKEAQLITDHRKLTEDVYRTTFEDGSFVVVNYSGSIYEAEGLSVEAMSYAIGKDVSGNAS